MDIKNVAKNSWKFEWDQVSEYFLNYNKLVIGSFLFYNLKRKE